jgi:hypothetical protein
VYDNFVSFGQKDYIPLGSSGTNDELVRRHHWTDIVKFEEY